ncbi:growth hormone secretagogue receptor type 1 [Rana temporaria]|uniref:growth hormone secretagogue receptor type 1 n=1 Tax=Rana temporaria TaxID=8407 RepID=UPI001AAC9A0F|nr:growth hormone secretagogue receptor type 1 [Rana temporaria]
MEARLSQYHIHSQVWSTGNKTYTPENRTMDYYYYNHSWPEDPGYLFPVPVLTGITVTCVFLFIIGIFGNIMTMLVVYKYKDMRTTTNLYLSSMAFSDLLIFVCMPLDLYRLWQYRPWNFGSLLCKLFQFISESCTYSTILNITALSVERYFAICFPLKAKVVITKGRVRLVIFVLWAVSFVSAGPIFVLVGVEHENGTNPFETNECKATEYAVKSGLLTIMVWTSSVFFFLPVFCLTVLYSLIGRKLWRRKRDTIGPCASHRDKNNRQTVKMLAVVVFAFILCWLPFHVARYLFSKSFEAGSLEIALISQYCNLVSFVLFYLSAAINPILYNIMSKKYRVAACRLFKLKKISRKAPYTTNDESSPAWTESNVST